MKYHTFRVQCSFTFQHSFGESETGPDPDGTPTDFMPTEEALLALQAELEARLGNQYHVESISLDVDSDDLLGTENDEN